MSRALALAALVAWAWAGPGYASSGFPVVNMLVKHVPFAAVSLLGLWLGAHGLIAAEDGRFRRAALGLLASALCLCVGIGVGAGFF